MCPGHLYVMAHLAIRLGNVLKIRGAVPARTPYQGRDMLARHVVLRDCGADLLAGVGVVRASHLREPEVVHQAVEVL